jgi:hypothetical protein
MVEELTDAERGALQALAPQSPDPSDAALENRVVAALHAEGLIVADGTTVTTGRRTSVRTWGLLAAAMLLFVAGIGTQRFLLDGAPGLATSPPAEPAAVAADRYLLLLLEAVDAPLPADLEAERVQEYSEWAGGLAAQGLLEAGEKLADGAVRVGPPLSGAPEAAEHVTGFFIVRAPDEASARELAAASPHARHGGRVEVRRIEPT